MVKNIAFATFSGSRDQIVIKITVTDGIYNAYINGEVFPLVAALYAVDRVGYVSDMEEFTFLVKFHKVELVQYRCQDNPNDKPFLVV